mmetsp:Transcript_24942/g.40044  ORF Transcript_24942/g.40044 Transcript_24942/m.40044 type:complete len:254 (+) Transcript_24942:374-1135(+)
MSSSCLRCAAACLSTSLCCSVCNIFWNSASAISVGGRFWATFSRAVIIRSHASSRSLWSLCAVAWYIDSSLTVAIILRVTSLMRDWKTLTFCDNSMVPWRPSTACCLSLSESADTSSKINSFSNKLSFLSFSLSSKSWVFILRVCRSRSWPPRDRHFLNMLFGFSSSNESSSVRFLTLETCSRKRITSSINFGTSGIFFCTTCSCLLTSFKSIFKLRSSSALVSIASSPFFRSFSWIFDFSQSIHSSSFLSIN